MSMLNALMNHFRHLRLKRGGAKISEKIQAFENFLRGNPADFTCGRGAWIEKGSKLIVAGDSARLTIGDFFYLNSYSIIDCHFSITIGARVQIGPLCYICDFDHDLIVDLTKPFHRSTNTHGAVVIKDNVWIGAGVKILKGVSIGENSVIAAGSVVTKNIPRNVVAAGVPAKIIKSLS